MTHRTVDEHYEYHSRLEPKKKRQRAKYAFNPLESVLRGRTPLQALMIAAEILGKPKSLRDEP